MDVRDPERLERNQKLRSELIAALRDGDDGPVRAFYDENLPAVYRYVLCRMKGSHDETEDVVADVFFQAFRDIRQYDPRHSPEAWLLGIARHRVLDACRRNGRKPFLELGFGQGADDTGEGLFDLEAEDLSARDMERAELAELIEGVLSQLPSEYEQILRQRYLEDRSVRELAAALQTTPKAAEARLFRARNAFRDAFRVAGRSLSPTAVVQRR
jgi:RNA polymerase sigma-70 factor (ECF subfamily)